MFTKSVLNGVMSARANLKMEAAAARINVPRRILGFIPHPPSLKGDPHPSHPGRRLSSGIVAVILHALQANTATDAILIVQKNRDGITHHGVSESIGVFR
jgi:hypothetical protein